MDFFRHFLLAVQFFTRIPVTGQLAAWVGYSPQMLQRCAAHFPAIGWLMGAAAAAVLAAALALLGAQPFAPLVAAVLATITTVWLTGGFHEDGLADTCDGLGGGATREKALHIMKDSRIGSYGTLALVLAIGLKVALLALLASRGVGMGAAALLGAHVLSRTAPLAQMLRLKYVGEADGSKSKPVVAEALPARSVAAGVLWAAPALPLL
ncbi:MAG: adenosylcobinamide-GDP ribazoletransferase, partial [Ottowia sp.]|nr:adenosylcobinamide-GDP ribazoletransferase [Ottowia sp.]